MTDDISDILAGLQQDHRNMALLLTHLDKAAERIHDGKDDNFELVDDIMLYMTLYPDTVHHPNENLLYAELRAVRPDLSSGMARVGTDHRSIEHDGIAIRDMVGSILSGDIVRRNAVVSATHRYAENLRKHMKWEEQDLFLRIRRMVEDGHRTVESAQILHKKDPLFTDTREAWFDELYQRLMSDLAA